MPLRITRRTALAAGLAPLAGHAAQADPDSPSAVERWGVFETQIKLPETGNPFGVALTAQFMRGHRTVEAAGFYDGDGVYKARFMPDSEGEWRWKFGDHSGTFVCTPPSKANHGPVSVRS